MALISECALQHQVSVCLREKGGIITFSNGRHSIKPTNRLLIELR